MLRKQRPDEALCIAAPPLLEEARRPQPVPSRGRERSRDGSFATHTSSRGRVMAAAMSTGCRSMAGFGVPFDKASKNKPKRPLNSGGSIGNLAHCKELLVTQVGLSAPANHAPTRGRSTGVASLAGLGPKAGPSFSSQARVCHRIGRVGHWKNRKHMWSRPCDRLVTSIDMSIHHL